MAKKRRKLKNLSEGKEKKKKLDDPNPDSEEFIYNEIDQFHRSKDKILLDATKDDSDLEIEEDEDDEVLAVNDSDDDDDTDEDQDEEEGSSGDEEDEDDLEKGLPSDKAWGKSRKAFYDADVKDDDVDASDEEAEIAAAEEEKEALTLQKRMAEKLDDEDFYTFEPEETKEETKEKEEKVVKDLSKLSKREKLEILAKESPELLPLLDEFSEKLSELMNKYHPLMDISRKGYIDSKKGIEFIQTKHQLLLNYLVNITFYLSLKANKSLVQGHPVIDVLVQHQKLLAQANEIEENLTEQIDDLLDRYKKGEFDEEKSQEEDGLKAIETKNARQPKKKNTRSQKLTDKISTGMDVDDDDDEDDLDVDPLAYYNQIKEKTERKKISKEHSDEEEDNINDEDDEDKKRMITYEMSKNKGLIRKRRKELKNPRVKHKMKYKKAKIKHKGQVREVQREISRYAGERTGIKATLAKSVKFK